MDPDLSPRQPTFSGIQLIYSLAGAYKDNIFLSVLKRSTQTSVFLNDQRDVGISAKPQTLGVGMALCGKYKKQHKVTLPYITLH